VSFLGWCFLFFFGILVMDKSHFVRVCLKALWEHLSLFYPPRYLWEQGGDHIVMKVSLICLNMCECVCVQGWRYEKNRDMIEIATCGCRRVRYFLGSKICGQLGSLPIHNFLCIFAKIRNYPRLYNGVENSGSYKALAPYFSFLQ